MFPFYLSIGMTAEQYWDGDASLTRAYREAEALRAERRNQELWLQGMYIYEAVLDASPILRSFAPAGTRPEPYPSEPYAITPAERKRRAEREEKERYERIRSRMYALAEQDGKK